MATTIKNRYDFVFLFDVKDGNPNGDPDQDNLPRVDAENQEGLVTDVCIKRKVRNYVEVKSQGNEDGPEIFIRQGNILNNIIEKAKGKTPHDRQVDLCKSYWDIRTFGAVLSTGENNAGTVRGPVQFTFSRSEDRVYQAEHSITRQAVATEEEAKKQEKREFASTIGRKSTVPYGLYRMHGFVSAVDAAKTGFSEDDLSLLWEALVNAFEHDRSAARGEMNPRKLIVFKHESHLGNARAGELFERVKVEKKKEVVLPRAWNDYEVSIERDKLPNGVSIEEKL
ncbi:MAG: type I-C CRISPR-associated protein Cas7/Csd2 [Candidatus Kryptoniota bacterium]